MNILSTLILFSVFIFVSSCNVKETTSTSDVVEDHTPISSKWAITSPTIKSYVENENLIYTFRSPQLLTVTGTPRVGVTIGATRRYLEYHDGSGSKSIRFRYTVMAADEDSNGVQLISPIELNGGTLKYPNSVNALLSFTVPNNATVKVDNTPPVITSTTITAAKTFRLGESIRIFLGLSERVFVTGPAQIPIEVAGVTKYATYTSGTGTDQLIFTYVVPASEEDLDGIVLLSDTVDIQGQMVDAAGLDLNPQMDTILPLPDTSNHFIDSLVPTILSTTLPADGTYKAADDLDFIFTFSENVDVTNIPRLAITLTSGTVYAQYFSGTGTDTITFRHTVQPLSEDLDGIAIASTLNLNATGTIQDIAGNNALLTHGAGSTALIFVDTSAPVVTLNIPNIINLANETAYGLSGTCSEEGLDVNVVIGGETITPAPVCTALAWSFTGYDISSVADALSVLITVDHQDAGGNNATQASANVLKDTVAPFVQTTASVAGDYEEDDVLNLNVTFNEDISITNTPQIPLTLDSGSRTFNYYTGTGSDVLNFRYTVVVGDYDANGISVGPSISLNGGTLTDAAGNNALLPLSTTSFATTKIIAPSNLIFDILATYDFGQVPLGGNLEQTFLINYTGAAPATTVGGTFDNPDFTFKGGSFPGTGGTCGATVSSNCTVVVRYTPSSAAIDGATLTMTYSGGSFTKDFTGEGVALTPTKLKVTTGPSSVIINNCIPFTISSVTASDVEANVSGNTTVTLVVNNGTGTFYSNAVCTSSIGSTSISTGTSSSHIYFQSTSAGQTLTLIFNTTGLSNTSHNVTTSNAPTAILAASAAEIETTSCAPVEVSLVDGSGIKTGASTSKTINISNSSSAVFYSDSFCTQVITTIGYNAYEGTKFIYTKNAVEEVANLNFTDAGGILSSDAHSVSFVDTLLWWDNGWTKRKRITLNNLDQATTHTSMPVLVRLSSSRISYSHFLSDGADIRFTLDDHTTVLKHEIEVWNSSGESLIWVNVPSITASSQKEIFMYYDNTGASPAEDAAALWSGYSGVWHMKKSGANYVDSTGSGKTAAPVGTITDNTGPSGNSVYFNGASSLNTGYDLAQVIGHDSTLSFWIRTTQVGSDTNWMAPGITGVEQAGGANDIFFGFIMANGRIAVSSGNAAPSASNFVVNDNNWRYVTMSRNETSGLVKFYVNGVLNGSATAETGFKSTAFQSFGVIGDTGGSPMYFNGYLDGLRLRPSVETDTRVKGEYKFTVETHMTYGPQEDL